MSSFFITGITGYIGQNILEHILEYYNTGDNTLILPVRTEQKKNTLAERLERNGWLGKSTIFVTDIEQIDSKMLMVNDVDRIDYIIHCAAPTASAFFISHPVQTYSAIAHGTEAVLQIAKFFRVTKMVYLSSMEVYGIVSDIGRDRGEEELGALDEKAPRSSYPLAKREAELFCKKYAEEENVNVCVARLAQTFGKNPIANDNRVFMQFARAVIANEHIELRTRGESVTNCCDIEEAVEAILFLLKNGRNGEVYNVLNRNNTMTIYEMAQLVATEVAPRFGRTQLEVVIHEMDRAVTGYPKETKLYMSAEKLRKLGFEAKKSIVEMYCELIESLL